MADERDLVAELVAAAEYLESKPAGVKARRHAVAVRRAANLEAGRIRDLPGLSPDDRELAAVLAGLLVGLSFADRYPFDDHERAMFRRASGLMARLIGRPDLDPTDGATEEEHGR